MLTDNFRHYQYAHHCIVGHLSQFVATNVGRPNQHHRTFPVNNRNHLTMCLHCTFDKKFNDRPEKNATICYDAQRVRSTKVFVLQNPVFLISFLTVCSCQFTSLTSFNEVDPLLWWLVTQVIDAGRAQIILSGR